MLDLLWRLFPASLRTDLREELELEYRSFVLPTRGRLRANAWYARQFAGSLLWSLFYRLRNLPARAHPMDTLLADLRFALRSFRRTRGLTALAVITVALGVGASTVVFSVLNAIVLQPLPYPDPDRLVWLWHDGVVSKSVMEQAIEGTSRFDPLAGTVEKLHTLTDAGEPVELSGITVSSGYWRMLGVRPHLGTLPDGERGPGDERLVVLSERLWRTRFDADTSVVGRIIRLDGEAATVTGVVEADFRPLDGELDFWMPMVIDRDNFSDYAGVGQVRLIGRLAAGSDIAAARDDIARVAERIHQESPDAYSEEWAARSAPRPVHDVVVESARGALWMTMGAVLLVLLIACANVANLLLARSGARQREIAIRIGLGADRGRIIRQLLTESLLLGVAGGGLGALVATWATESLGAAWAQVLPRVNTIGVDPAMLAFALATTVGAALLFGFAPAWRASSLAPREHLAQGGNASTSAGNRRLAGVLVTVEVALAVVLVIGAGLMLRTLGELVSVEPGFDASDVTTFRVRVPAAETAGDEPGGTAAGPAAFVAQVRENLEALPGVRSVGAVSFLPMATGTPSAIYWRADTGRPENETPPNANFQLISGDYFETLRIPLLKGRLFRPQDTEEGAFVGVINATMAREAFGDEEPLGRRLVMFGGTEFEVVGVVADSRQRSPDREPAPEAFFAFEQAPLWPNLFLVARTDGAAPSADSIRRAVWSVDASVPVLSLRSMSEVVREASGRTRLFTRALGGFGGLALLLAAVGVYGVARHSLGQQVREFGIRMALGATPQRIVGQALARSVRTVLIGAVLGIAAAAALARLMQGLLYGVSALDPLTFLAVPLLLALVGVLAAWLPARRLAKMDPKRSLSA